MSDREDFALRAVHDWSATLPSLTASPDELSAAIRLSRVSDLQDRLDDQTLRQFERDGIRGTDDFRALAILRRAPPGGVTNSALLDQLGGSKAGMSTRLERFTKHGITIRIPSSVDRRSHTNALTDHGRDIADQAVSAVVTARRRLFSDLSADQLKQFTQTLAVIIGTIDPHD